MCLLILEKCGIADYGDVQPEVEFVKHPIHPTKKNRSLFDLINVCVFGRNWCFFRFHVNGNTQYVHLSEMLLFIAIEIPFPDIRKMPRADNVTCGRM